MNEPAIFDSSFNVVIDGIASGALSIPKINYWTGNSVTSGQSLAAALQSAINSDATIAAAGKSVTVAYSESGGNVNYTITSNEKGLDSTVEFNSVSNLPSRIGITNNIGSPVVGAGGGANEIGGEPATYANGILTGTGIYAGFELKVTGSTTG